MPVSEIAENLKRLPPQPKWDAYRQAVREIRPTPVALALVFRDRPSLYTRYMRETLSSTVDSSDEVAVGTALQILESVSEYKSCADPAFADPEIRMKLIQLRMIEKYKLSSCDGATTIHR